MNQPFKELEPQAELPPETRDQTLGSVYALRCVMDMAELFLAAPFEVLIHALSPAGTEDQPASPPDNP
ncbi:MAG: hypothetical protein SF053_02435 [Bacteroidia bacterium]|nr:hypothetical protein [Bacteroidia bacterium]